MELVLYYGYPTALIWKIRHKVFHKIVCPTIPYIDERCLLRQKQIRKRLWIVKTTGGIVRWGHRLVVSASYLVRVLVITTTSGWRRWGIRHGISQNSSAQFTFYLTLDFNNQYFFIQSFSFYLFWLYSQPWLFIIIMVTALFRLLHCSLY